MFRGGKEDGGSSWLPTPMDAIYFNYSRKTVLPVFLPVLVRAQKILQMKTYV